MYLYLYRRTAYSDTHCIRESLFPRDDLEPSGKRKFYCLSQIPSAVQYAV